MDEREYSFDKLYVGNEYFCVDIETTGLDEKNGDIIELYWKIMKNNKKIQERHCLFYSPDWQKTKNIHQIEYWELKKKKPFDSIKNLNIRNELLYFINRCKDKNDPLIFMAQYAPFELKWFKEKLNVDLTNIKVYDTRLAEKFLYPDLSHSLIPMCSRRNIKSPNNIDFHRASWDVDAMWLCAFQQFDELKNNKIQNIIYI